MPIVLSQCGIVLADGRPPPIDEWQAGLRTIAQGENAYRKISGIPIFDHEWTVDSLRPGYSA